MNERPDSFDRWLNADTGSEAGAPARSILQGANNVACWIRERLLVLR